MLYLARLGCLATRVTNSAQLRTRATAARWRLRAQLELPRVESGHHMTTPTRAIILVDGIQNQGLL